VRDHRLVGENEPALFGRRLADIDAAATSGMVQRLSGMQSLLAQLAAAMQPACVGVSIGVGVDGATAAAVSAAASGEPRPM